MKKLISIMSVLLTLILLLSSCDVLFPTTTTVQSCVVHQWSEYKYNERVHWREYTCGCPWPEIVEEHINMDSDMLCDICGAPCECKHVDADKNEVCDNCGIEYIIVVWQYTDTHHWMIYDSPIGNPVPDIVLNEGEHIDENEDGTCDMCSYKIKTE